jgi:hypothetical protein
MIDLLPDESKKVELREMREAYSLAADFANGSAAQNKVCPPGSRRFLTMELTCNLNLSPPTSSDSLPLDSYFCHSSILVFLSLPRQPAGKKKIGIKDKVAKEREEAAERMRAMLLSGGAAGRSEGSGATASASASAIAGASSAFVGSEAERRGSETGGGGGKKGKKKGGGNGTFGFEDAEDKGNIVHVVS